MLLQQFRRLRHIGGLYKRLARGILQSLQRCVHLLHQRKRVYLYGIRRHYKYLYFVCAQRHLPQYVNKCLRSYKRD